MKADKTRYVGTAAATAALLAAYGFFQFAYPYHLVRREQMNLFLFDWDYIGQTYGGNGWLARFVCDFLEQFFHLPVAGPLVIGLLLTGIGAVTYKIARTFLGKWPSLGVAAVLYAWSFLRETENLFSTRYTLVVLGYLALVLLALRFRKTWMKLLAAVLLLAFGAWSLGSPYHRYYGKWWGTPVLSYDKVIGLDAELARENWDKVIKLSEKDLHFTEASYCYNLAHAMKGDLPRVLFGHSQNGVSSLLLRISTDRSAFTNCLAGEAWFQLGDMTLAEQSAIIMLQASPKHTGVRYLVRMARTSLASGEMASARKYLGMLGKTLFYGKWARQALAGKEDSWLEQTRPKLSKTDFVHYSTRPRNVLRTLLEADPSNALARDYLLCLDLLEADLDHFMEDWPQGPTNVPAYQEALLIWLSLQDKLDQETLSGYGIPMASLDRMERFFQNPALYRNSYWYYYLNATEED